MLVHTNINARLGSLTLLVLLHAVAVRSVEVAKFGLVLGPDVWFNSPSAGDDAHITKGPILATGSVDKDATKSTFYNFFKKASDGSIVDHKCVFTVPDDTKLDPLIRYFAIQTVEPYFPGVGGLKQDNGGVTMTCELVAAKA